MEREDTDSDCVTFTKQDNAKIPPKQESNIAKEIFDSAAKCRTKHMLDKALQLQQNRTSKKQLVENMAGLNDAGDFKEAPKFRRRLRLKTKSSSLSNVTFSDVIVIDENSPSQCLSQTIETINCLPLSSKDRNVHEGFTNLKEITATCSKETSHLVSKNENLEETSCQNSLELTSNQSCQACIVCGMNIDSGVYKTHRLHCLRHNFSKPDKGKAAEDGESTEQVQCHMCNKNITHLNSQRRAQHINKCIDKEDVTRQEETIYQQQIQAARTAVLSCPLCGRKFKVQSSRQSHLKKCAVTNKMTVEQVKNLLKQQEEEHQAKLNAGILPEDFIPTKSKPLQRKQSKVSRPKGQFDEDTQLALALSTSLAQDEEKRDYPLGMLVDNAGNEDQAVSVKGHRRNKKGKGAQPASLLMTLPREEAGKRISDRITRYIFSANQNGRPDPATPPFKTRTKLESASTPASMVPQAPPFFWNETSLGVAALKPSSMQPLMSRMGDLCFYVKELMPPVSVNTVFTGSKLKRVSSIPGWRMSEATEQHPEINKNGSTSTVSPSSSQTVEILAKLAMESDLDNGEIVGFGHSDLQEDSLQDVDDGDCSLQPSGFCKESTVKVESDSTDVISSYLSLVNCPSFSDLVIKANKGTEIRAHKLILHARCPELLATSSVQNGKDIIDLTSYGQESILCMLNYIYAGQTSLNTSGLADVKRLADRFSLPKLEAATSDATVFDLESSNMDGEVDATGECEHEVHPADAGSGRKEINNRDTFDDSDWLDVFLTQRDNKRLRAESVTVTDCHSKSQDDGMMEQSGEMTANFDQEVETRQDNNEEEETDRLENSDLNVSNVGRGDVSMEVEHAAKVFHVISTTKNCETRCGSTGDLSEEMDTEEVFNSSQEIRQTSSPHRSTPEQNNHSQLALADIEKSKYLGHCAENCTLHLFANEYCQIEGNLEDIEAKSEVNESVTEGIPQGFQGSNNTSVAGSESREVSISENSLIADHSLAADISSDSLAQRLIANHSLTAESDSLAQKLIANHSLTAESDSLAQKLIANHSLTAESDSLAQKLIANHSLTADSDSLAQKLMANHSLTAESDSLAQKLIANHSLTADSDSLAQKLIANHSLTAESDSLAQRKDPTVCSQVRKRKRKKVGVKEFKTLIHKVVSTLSDSKTDPCQQLLADLTDDDVQRINIKIEQDLQATHNPNDSVYIPNVLEDTGEENCEVIITHADIKTPLTPKRGQSKKLDVNACLKGPELSRPDRLSTLATPCLHAARSLTMHEQMALSVQIGQMFPQFPGSTTGQMFPQFPGSTTGQMLPQFPGSTSTNSRPAVSTTTNSRPPVSTTANSRPAVSTTANPRPAVSTTTNPRPAISTTANPRPAVSTTANPRPAVSTTANPRPTVSTTINPRPAVSTTTNSRPAVSTTTNPRPAVSTTANPRPAVSTTINPRPAVSTTTNSRPAVSTTTNSRPAVSTTTNSRPAVSTSTNSRPAVSTSTNSRPAVSTTTNSRPAVSTSTNSRPAVSTTTNSRPAVSTSTNSRPAVSTTANPRPAVSTSTNSRPAVSTSTNSRPAGSTTTNNSRPPVSTTASFRPAVSQMPPLNASSTVTVQTTPIEGVSLLQIQVCEAAPKKPSSSTPIQCSQNPSLAKLLTMCLKSQRETPVNHSYDDSSLPSQASEVSGDHLFTPGTSSRGLSSQSSSGDKVLLNSSSLNEFYDNIYSDICHGISKSCQSQCSPIICNLTGTQLPPLSAKSTNEGYISGEELFTDDEDDSKLSSSKIIPSKLPSPSDPYWMCTTHLVSCSPVSKQITNNTVRQKEKSVRRSIFSPEHCGSPSTASISHSANTSNNSANTSNHSPNTSNHSANISNNSANTSNHSANTSNHSAHLSNQPEQSVNMSSHNSTVTSPDNIKCLISIYNTMFPETNKDPRLEAQTREKLSNNHSVTNVSQSPETYATLPKTAVAKKATQLFGRELARTNEESHEPSFKKPDVNSNSSTMRSPGKRKTMPNSVEHETSGDCSASHARALGRNRLPTMTPEELARHSSQLAGKSEAAIKSNITRYYSGASQQQRKHTSIDTVVSRSISYSQSEIFQNTQSPCQLTSHQETVLPASMVSIESPKLTETSNSCGHVKQTPNSSNIVYMQEYITNDPQYSNAANTEKSFILGTLSAVKNGTKTTPAQTNLLSEQAALSAQGTKLSTRTPAQTNLLSEQAALSAQGTKLSTRTPAQTNLLSEQAALSVQSTNVSRNVGWQQTAEIPSGKASPVKMAIISRGREINLTNRASQVHQEKATFARQQAKYIDPDSPLPLRQRLGLSNPFHPTVRGQPGQVRNKERLELNPKPETSTSEAEAVVGGGGCGTMGNQKFKMSAVVDPMGLKGTKVIENLLDQISDEPTNVQMCSVNTPEQQTSRRLKTKKHACKQPSPFTPMAPYDQMATPDLKKAVSKIGVRPLGKKRMREILKHVYHETHQYETDSDYDGTPVKYRRADSQPSELSSRAKLSHLPIQTSGMASIHNKLKPITKEATFDQPNQANKKTIKKTTIECTITNLQQIDKSLPRIRDKGIPGNDGLITAGCASLSEGSGDNQGEMSGSQDSSYSDGPDVPEESILQGWPEDDVTSSQMIQPNSQTVAEKLVTFVRQNKDVYESILMYEPLELDVLKKRVSAAAIKANMSQVMDFLDERCITFTMKNMSSRNNNRHRAARPKYSGKSPRKTKASQKTASSFV